MDINTEQIAQQAIALVERQLPAITLSGYTFILHDDPPIGIRVGEIELKSLEVVQTEVMTLIQGLLPKIYGVTVDDHLEIYAGIMAIVGYIAGNHFVSRTKNTAELENPVMTFRKWKSHITITFTTTPTTSITVVGVPL